MSLAWDTSKCPDGPVNRDTPDVEWQQLQVLILSLMSTDEAVIDEDETLFRLRFLERLGFALTVEPMPAAAIRRWRGTTVNVAPKTRQQFITRWTKEARRHVEAAVARELRQEVSA